MMTPDDAAFRELYDAHHQRVYALAVRLSDSRDEAEDLVQEAFLAAWPGLSRFRGDADVGTWLHRITVRLSLRQRETRDRRARLWLENHEPASEHAIGSDIEARMDLERAIGRVPRQARAVLVLHDIHGYAHGEIAEMLGVTTGTTRSQLHRARHLMIEAMEK